jgi:hypothetical protein
MTDESTKTRTITLTDRAPVRVLDGTWPIIASSRRGDGGTISSQDNHRWYLTVRAHADGRVIVYGSEQSGPGGVRSDYEPAYAGELLEAGEAVTVAIRRVGENARCSEAMISECIADLPAVDLE